MPPLSSPWGGADHGAIDPFELTQQVQQLRALGAPFFVPAGRPWRRLPLKLANVVHRTLNHKQAAHDRLTVEILEALASQATAVNQFLGRAPEWDAATWVAAGAMERAQGAVDATVDLSATITRLAAEIHGLDEWVRQLHDDEEGLSQRAAHLDQRVNELMLQARSLVDGDGSTDFEGMVARVVDQDRFDRLVGEPAGPKLNIGCGSQILPDHLNIDGRELPGVDVVADVRHLPFEPATVGEIYSSHTIEHFREHQLRSAVLPHWIGLLRPGGKIRLLCPDLDGLLARVQRGSLSLEEFRLYMYGAQDYVGNDHLASYNAGLLGKLLEDLGLSDVQVVATDRLSNGCPEIELVASKPE